jgi:pimeloyl-ACP methyl ester carboxylesterase
LKLFLGSLLDIPSARAQIPDLIAELAQGRTDTLVTEKAELENLGAMLGRYPQSPSSIPLVSIISSSENNARPDLTADQVAKEKASLLFATALPALLVSPAVPLYAHDATFGKEPAHLPRTLVLQGTLDPKTPFEGAERHVAMLKKAGPVTLLAVKDAPHFVLFTAPLCFEAAAQSFVRGGVVKAPSCSKPETEKSAP